MQSTKVEIIDLSLLNYLSFSWLRFSYLIILSKSYYLKFHAFFYNSGWKKCSKRGQKPFPSPKSKIHFAEKSSGFWQPGFKVHPHGDAVRPVSWPWSHSDPKRWFAFLSLNIRSISSFYIDIYLIEEIGCCTPNPASPECFPIEIPTSDRFYSWVNSTAKCLNFMR